MNRAIDAARRVVRRDRLVDQPPTAQAVSRAAARGDRGRTGRAARGTHPRGRCAARGDPRPAAGRTAGRRAPVPGQTDRHLPVGNRSRRHGRLRHRREHHPKGVARAGRRGRRHHAVELPVRGHHQQARAGAGDRQHRRAQARARHAVQRHPARPAHRREDRHPSGCRQRRHGVGPLRRRGTDAVAEGRHDLVHRFDGRRQADHGEGRRDHEAAVPRAGRQVGDDRAGGRRLQHGLPDRHRRL